ncbi:NADH-quinone oxidoreductase subunit NuoG [Leeia oryzae]|uniref:NADH-quinone oxidoreductase subunit NuoG n=1 Tax=Leeia oryzae TaxID=356662 RepID=UPI00039998AB|nr:NADH-quinone oxidoreductase subunit NuoG [Leeia oryzae]
MLEIEINGQQLTVETGSTVMDAANQAGVYIPHFCYHKKLSIAANCRMCLVEVEKAPKPLPACATPVTDGMKVKTHSELAAKAQKGVMEFLLINHPLDCPICDQGGECQLQDLAVGYGGSSSRYEEEKRVVANKDLGPLISTDMTRCIHCTRCVRFGDEIAGRMELGMANRGEHSEIMPFISKTVDSELSGNMIDLCPVGALTSKPFRYSARTWELSRRKSVSPHDGLGSNLIVQVKHNKVYRVLPNENEAINECWIADRDRFSYEALNSEARLTKPMIKNGGIWKEVSWTQVLEYVAHGLLDIRKNSGASEIAGLISPHSTTEEIFLFQKLLRAFGTNNIDSRIKQSDFSADSAYQGIPWLGQSIAEFSSLNSMLLVGSNLRKEIPLLASRVRYAVKHGASVATITAKDTQQYIKFKGKALVSPANFANTLLAVLHAVAQSAGKPLPASFDTKVEVTALHQEIAKTLLSGEKQVILLGAEAQYHPQFATLLAIANAIAELSGAIVSVPALAANSVGAWAVGAVPTDAGDNAVQMFAKPKQAYVLFNVEPELDTYNPAQAVAALSSAKMVVVCSAFKSAAAEQYADVMLPITPFSETAGSYVNTEGKLQPFNGVVKPQGDARPAWKVLRVLADVLELPGFAYDSAEEVRADALDAEKILSRLNNRLGDGFAVNGLSAVDSIVRHAEVPLYNADPIVRRAPALQATKDVAVPVAVVNPALAERMGLSAGAKVQVKQANATSSFELVIDSLVADNTVSIPAGHPATSMLGGYFDHVSLERV